MKILTTAAARSSSGHFGATAELHSLNKRLDHGEGLLRIAHELTTLNDSLQALAYAALGHQGPQVRRRRTG
jgi:hypothetical protein